MQVICRFGVKRASRPKPALSLSNLQAHEYEASD
jgi:hypothetical protein